MDFATRHITDNIDLPWIYHWGLQKGYLMLHTDRDALLQKEVNNNTEMRYCSYNHQSYKDNHQHAQHSPRVHPPISSGDMDAGRPRDTKMQAMKA